MIKSFLTYLQAIKGYSDNTITAYERDLMAFAGWLREHKEDARWSTTTREDVDAFIIEQHDKGLSAATTNRQLAAISSLYRYFQRNGMDVENPAKYESRRKIADTIPNTIPYANIILAYRHARGFNKFMLGMLATTGIRLQEFLDLTWEDINWEDNSIKIQGKGSKERTVHTEASVLRESKELYDMAHPKGRMIWISQRQARYQLWETLRPFCRCKQLSPHAIRHSYATELARQGLNVAQIAKALGHKNISTTQKYIDMAQVAAQKSCITLN